MKASDNYLFLQTGTAREALSMLNIIAIPNVAIFIVNEFKILVGSLTDGDIRRGLLAGKNIDESVTSFMNTTSKYFKHGQDNFEQTIEFKKLGIRFIPLVNNQLQIVDIIDLDKLKSILPIDAIIMAGGKGERLKPLTDTVPKPMLLVGNEPIIMRNINRLSTYGVTNFHIAVRHMANQIIDGVTAQNKNEVQLNFITETVPLGTIGAIKLIENFSNEVILLMNSDLLTNIDFNDFYTKFIASGADMQVATVPYYVDVPYAVMNINENDQVLSFSEKPRYVYYSNAGIYIFKKSLIDLIPPNIEFDATNFMEVVIGNNKKLNSYPLLSYWLDIGRIDDFYKAQEDVKHLSF